MANQLSRSGTPRMLGSLSPNLLEQKAEAHNGSGAQDASLTTKVRG